MKLVLSDGTQFRGIANGYCGKSVVGEVIYNSSMVGYQEIFSDPSYAGQIVVMTYPLIGQYGICDDDSETRVYPGPLAVVVHEICHTPSNFRSVETLDEWLEEKGIPCLSDVDTRMITRTVRATAPARGALVPDEMPVEEALAMIRSYSPQSDIVSRVSCAKRWFSCTPRHKFDVVVVDCGLKRSIVTELNARGCNVTIVPWNTSADEIMSYSPSAVLLSSGPGDPRDCTCVLATISALKGRIPLAGIGLGYQLIGLSYGARLDRMPEGGHHGGSPVRETSTGRIFTAQLNHVLSLNRPSVENTSLRVSYENVPDGIVEGIECLPDRVMACEFTPEGAPGPRESSFFDQFIKMMED